MALPPGAASRGAGQGAAGRWETGARGLRGQPPLSAALRSRRRRPWQGSLGNSRPLAKSSPARHGRGPSHRSPQSHRTDPGGRDWSPYFLEEMTATLPTTLSPLHTVPPTLPLSFNPLHPRGALQGPGTLPSTPASGTSGFVRVPQEEMGLALPEVYGGQTCRGRASGRAGHTPEEGRERAVGGGPRAPVPFPGAPPASAP